jgi:hypothetical protein
MTKKVKDPKGITGPPIVLVAVKNDRREGSNPKASAEDLKRLLTQIVPSERVIEVGNPIDLLSPGDMPCFEEQRVFIRFKDTNRRVV